MPVEITPAWECFYGKVQRRTGLDLRNYRQEQMQRRILGLVDARKLGDLETLGVLVEQDADEARRVINRLAINVSELYRNPEKWVELETSVLPLIYRKNQGLRCWSAGCSYGAEALTLASILHRKFPGDHQILGTDIDESAIGQARLGFFTPNDVRAVPADVLRSDFISTDGGWQARPELRRMVTFRAGNLLADRFAPNFDLILCRNVVIYFNDSAKLTLYQRFFQALRPGGFLFTGSTERIPDARKIGYESPLPFFYQKPSEELQSWRNAS